MVDYSKLNRIEDIKKEIFKLHGKELTKSEKDYFFDHSLVNNDIKNARNVAYLLEKIEEANGLRKVKFQLLNDLEQQQQDDSVAFQVLESKNNLVTVAIRHLRSISTDLDKIKSQITLLKNLLRDDKEGAAELKKIEDDISPIENKISELIGKSGAIDKQIEKLNEKIVELLNKKNEKEEQKKSLSTNKSKYQKYLEMLENLKKKVESDATAHGNKRDVELSRIKGSITDTQMTNAIFFFIKEVLEKVDEKELSSYMKTSNASSIENWLKAVKIITTDSKVFVTLKDSNKYVKRDKDGNPLKDSSDNVIFDNVTGDERKM